MDFNLLVLNQKSPKLKIFKSQNLNILKLGNLVLCHVMVPKKQNPKNS